MVPQYTEQPQCTQDSPSYTVPWSLQWLITPSVLQTVPNALSIPMYWSLNVLNTPNVLDTHYARWGEQVNVWPMFPPDCSNWALVWHEEHTTETLIWTFSKIGSSYPKSCIQDTGITELVQVDHEICTDFDNCHWLLTPLFTEAPSKVFLLFFLLPDWLKLNHLKSRLECGLSDIFRAIFVPP